jgi:hypothetical protein
MDPLSRSQVIISLMQALKYKANQKGVCAGLTTKAIEAFSIGELDVFDSRIERLYKIYLQYQKNGNDPIRQLAEYINGILENRLSQLVKNPKSPPSSAVLEVSDFLAFFEGIELAQNPELYTGWFPRKTGQTDYEDISKLTAPDRLQTSGTLAVAAKWPGIYTYSPTSSNERELVRYVDAIMLAASMADENIALRLESPEHAIFVGYDAKQRVWKVTNLGGLPTKTIEAYESEDLVNAIYSSFITDGGPIAFETIVLATEKTREQAQEFVSRMQKMDEYKEAHGLDSSGSIKDEKFQYRTYGAATTLLKIAAINGHADLVEYILKKKPKKMTAELIRYSSAALGDKKMIETFAKFAGSMDMPLLSEIAFLAARHGCLDVLDNLADKHKFDLEGNCFGLMGAAFAGGQYDIVEYIRKASTIELKDMKRKGGITLAVDASINGDVKALHYLQKETGFLKDPEQVSEVMKFAVKYGHVPVVRFLNEHGLLDMPDENGMTPLFHAIKYRQTGIIQYLAESAKVKLDQENRQGMTPAVYAASRGDLEMLKVLKMHGVDLSLRASCGKTPLEMAKESKNVPSLEDSEKIDRIWNDVIDFLRQAASMKSDNNNAVTDVILPAVSLSTGDQKPKQQSDQEIVHALKELASNPGTTKEFMKNAILNSQLSPRAKLDLYTGILEKEDNPLTRLFWKKRGMFAPNVESGTLKDLKIEREMLLQQLQLSPKKK